MHREVQSQLSLDELRNLVARACAATLPGRAAAAAVRGDECFLAFNCEHLPDFGLVVSDIPYEVIGGALIDRLREELSRYPDVSQVLCVARELGLAHYLALGDVTIVTEHYIAPRISRRSFRVPLRIYVASTPGTHPFPL